MSMRSVCLAIACLVGACTTPATETSVPAPAPAPAPESAQLLDEDVVELGAELTAVKIIAPTQAMLTAALDDDPEAMRDAATSLAGCQAASTCPTEYGSCSSWSAGSQCEVTCFPGTCPCRPIWSPDCEGVPPTDREVTWYNKFRVCFNASGQSCTEWQKTGVSHCGGC
jgi:hypothetical protein